MGCHVVERHDTELIGKGYALSYLLSTMIDSGVADDYDAYFVFDADNRLDRHYVEEMNKAFQSGFRILTSYRNSVNLADNWVSSGSALWFIRESRFLNNSRMILGSSCHVGGTGFMFSREVMRRNRGWKFHLLTEDLEFTMDSILHATASDTAAPPCCTTSSRSRSSRAASATALEQGIPAGVPVLRHGADQAGRA